MPSPTQSSDYTDTAPANLTLDPFRVLGLKANATDEQIRHRYLELVRQHPPERDGDQFRQIYAAYQAARDPLVQAERLLRKVTEPRPWNELIDEARRNPPRMNVDFLLSLGNRTTSPAAQNPVAQNPAAQNPGTQNPAAQNPENANE